MSGEKKWTDVDLILARRAGAREQFISGSLYPTWADYVRLWPVNAAQFEEAIARRHPLPKVTVAREILLPQRSGEPFVLRMRADGAIESKGSWFLEGWGLHMTKESVDAAISLRANPTEERDAE